MRSHALHHFIFFTHSFCFSAGLTNNEFVRRDLWAKAWMWAHSAVLFDTHGNFCSSSLFELDTSDGSVWCVCCTPIACLVSPFLFCHYSVQAIYRYKIERSLYDIISISDFHRMNMIKRTADAYVKPLFATGYSLGITCLRLWRDFFLFFGFRCAVCVCVWMNTTVCNECVARLAMKFIFFFFNSIIVHAHLRLPLQRLLEYTLQIKLLLRKIVFHFCALLNIFPYFVVNNSPGWRIGNCRIQIVVRGKCFFFLRFRHLNLPKHLTNSNNLLWNLTLSTALTYRRREAKFKSENVNKMRWKHT